MSILLIILKIIGILLLVILVLAALFLFHPIFYQIEGEAEEEISAEGYFWWLFQILRLEFKIENMEAQWRFRIFGFTRHASEKESEEAFSEDEPEQMTEYEDVNSDQTESVDTKSGEMVTDLSSFEEKEGAKGKQLSSEKEDAGKKKVSKKKDKEKKDKKIKEKHKKENRKKQFETLKKEFTDSGNHQAVSHLWKELCYLLAHLKPRYLRADISYSAGDPAVTGKATGILALFPIIYRYDAHIYPDFLSEEFYIRGSLKLKGHMALYHFIRSLLRLMRNKNVTRLYGKIRK